MPTTNPIYFDRLLLKKTYLRMYIIFLYLIFTLYRLKLSSNGGLLLVSRTSSVLIPLNLLFPSVVPSPFNTDLMFKPRRCGLSSKRTSALVKPLILSVLLVSRSNSSSNSNYKKENICDCCSNISWGVFFWVYVCLFSIDQ